MLILKAVSCKDAQTTVSFIIYGSSLITLFFASALYHGFQAKKIKSILRVIDHSAIYILIAGTYTPITLVSLRGGWGWSLFGVAWGLALIGIIFNGFYKDRFHKISTATYVLMGWSSVIALPMLFSSLGLEGFILLVAGGLIYTLGLVFYTWDDLSFSHVIWHLFVIGGAVCHYLVVYFYVTPN